MLPSVVVVGNAVVVVVDHVVGMQGLTSTTELTSTTTNFELNFELKVEFEVEKRNRVLNRVLNP
jgi:hypothetical protein